MKFFSVLDEYERLAYLLMNESIGSHLSLNGEDTF